MKTRINKDFFEKWKDKNVVMWCKTEEYAIEFCKILDMFDFVWDSEYRYKNKNRWYVYEEDTCYNFNEGQYADLKFYKENTDYAILDFEDYIIEENCKQQKIINNILKAILLKTKYVEAQTEIDYTTGTEYLGKEINLTFPIETIREIEIYLNEVQE